MTIVLLVLSMVSTAGAEIYKWVDEDGKDWSHLVKFNLPDKDVFVIDANADSF